ncbi:hypothetical protein GH789_17015 [Rhizobium pusense]|nr:hypothetical protein [Agrobacterium pusense]
MAFSGLPRLTWPRFSPRSLAPSLPRSLAPSLPRSLAPSLPRSLGLSYDSRWAGSLPRLTFAISLGRGSWEIQGWTFAAG